MWRIGAPTLLVCAAAALSGAAQAKEPAEGTLCGSSGCVALEGYDASGPFSSWWSTPFSEAPAPKPAPFFRVVARQSAPDGLGTVTWTLLYVPQRHAMRITQSRVPPYSTGIGPYWRTIPRSARAALLRATKDIKPFLPSSSWQTCTLTVVRRPVPDPAQHSFNYGNATIRVSLFPKNGRLVAGRLPGGGWRATINEDGSIDAKFGWWRAGSGKIRITGRRLDAPAPPLRAHVPDGYETGFQATGLTFPTTGCWRVTGRYRRASLTFTMLVTKSPLGS
ncbi:MAG: hypothetical protein QOF45_2081 [Gaiellaceae bacterium]|nr:hypothetical protein [Gaiellaceae bacterium]